MSCVCMCACLIISDSLLKSFLSHCTPSHALTCENRCKHLAKKILFISPLHCKHIWEHMHNEPPHTHCIPIKRWAMCLSSIFVSFCVLLGSPPYLQGLSFIDMRSQRIIALIQEVCSLLNWGVFEKVESTVQNKGFYSTYYLVQKK